VNDRECGCDNGWIYTGDRAGLPHFRPCGRCNPRRSNSPANVAITERPQLLEPVAPRCRYGLIDRYRYSD
jgi:methylphosphotriester-DNA--protein-cysteine methyltransferase